MIDDIFGQLAQARREMRAWEAYCEREWNERDEPEWDDEEEDDD